MLNLHQKLSSLISLSENFHTINPTQYKQQIKTILLTYNEYISQQFIKLSVYYETKLQYQSSDYEQQIKMLKKQIQRQYKVIGLMKNQLEDLVVMVNLQRAGGIGQEGRERQMNIGQVDDQHRQWRVKREQGYKTWQNSDNTQPNNNINLQSQKQSPSLKSQSQQQQNLFPTISPSSNNNNTIFGLQIIAQQQTQRTLMSVCEQQQREIMNYDSCGNQNNQLQQQQDKDCCDDNDQVIQIRKQQSQGLNEQQQQKKLNLLQQSPIIGSQNNYGCCQNNNTKNLDFTQQQDNEFLYFANNNQSIQHQKTNKNINNKNQNNTKDVAVQFSNETNNQKNSQTTNLSFKNSLIDNKSFRQQSKQEQQQYQSVQKQNTKQYQCQTQYEYQQLLFGQLDKQKRTLSNRQGKIIHKKSVNCSKNSHLQSIKPSIYYSNQQQEIYSQQNNCNRYQNKIKTIPISSQTRETNNFVSNPFSKNKSLSSLKTKQIQQQRRQKDFKNHQQRQLSPKLFLQQFRKSFAQQKTFIQRQQQYQIKKEKQDVMSILQMIAMKGSTQNSKRSRRKCGSTNRDSSSNKNSRSKRKLQNQQSLIAKNTNYQRKRILTQQSSFGMKQSQEEQQFLSHYKKLQSLSLSSEYKRNRVKNNRFQTEGLTNNNQQIVQQCTFTQQTQNLSEYYKALSSNNQLQQQDNFSQNYLFVNNNQQQQHVNQQFRSLQTTFGRPVSFQCLRQIKDNNNLNNRDQYCSGDDRYNYDKIQRKFSMGGIMLGDNKVAVNKNGTKMGNSNNNKENQRQRRMSEKLPSSNNKGRNNIATLILEKKPSTKFIKNKQTITSSQQRQPQSSSSSSIASMLQSHLQHSNKFLIGSKKQQIKYDGQRITYGHMTLKHGHGILYYSNGLIYEGEFVQNKRHGYGLLKFNHVELYSGQWNNDQLHGKGKIRNCAIINKKKKDAGQGNNYVSGGINGQHNNNWSSGNNMFIKWISYCGEFKSNRFEGEGTLYLQGGQKFVGWFRNGVADGQGSLFKKNGQVESGRWKNNILIQKYEMEWQ